MLCLLILTNVAELKPNVNKLEREQVTKDETNTKQTVAEQKLPEPTPETDPSNNESNVVTTTVATKQNVIEIAADNNDNDHVLIPVIKSSVQSFNGKQKGRKYIRNTYKNGVIKSSDNKSSDKKKHEKKNLQNLGANAIETTNSCKSQDLQEIEKQLKESERVKELFIKSFRKIFNERFGPMINVVHKKYHQPKDLPEGMSGGVGECYPGCLVEFAVCLLVETCQICVTSFGCANCVCQPGPDYCFN